MATKIYQAVKNYIHNELEIDLRQLIEDEVRRYVQELMRDSSYLQSIIEKEVRKNLDYKLIENIAFYVSKRIRLEIDDKKSKEDT